MSYNLFETFYLSRAGRYTTPENTNDRLPIIYGDMTDGNTGNWSAPCIDTTPGAEVFCFASHETLSVANGNSIAVYDDDVLVNPANYTFNHSHNFESEGVISSITFSSSPTSNSNITVTGKGKPTSPGSNVLMENIVDILIDYLVNETDSGVTDGDIDSTYKAVTKNKFIDADYTAAGAIVEDNVIWETLTLMMSSFNGGVLINNNNKIVFRMKTSSSLELYGEVVDIIDKGDMSFISANIRYENILNRIPIRYSYNYAKKDFNSITDTIAASDTASINIYGTRKPSEAFPLYWCRNINDAVNIQSLLVNRQNTQSKVWEIYIKDNTLKRVHLNAGDYVVASIDELYDSEGMALSNAILEIIDINYDFNKGVLEFRCLDTGFYKTLCWKADGTVQADGSRKACGDRDYVPRYLQYSDGSAYEFPDGSLYELPS